MLITAFAWNFQIFTKPSDGNSITRLSELTLDYVHFIIGSNPEKWDYEMSLDGQGGSERHKLIIEAVLLKKLIRKFTQKLSEPLYTIF